MGNPKQKWTAEEEEALIKGIHKHGVGKWKNIETDPELNIHFRNRTNIDLKCLDGFGPRRVSCHICRKSSETASVHFCLHCDGATSLWEGCMSLRRSNGLCKDKWRNISPGLPGSGTRSRNPKAKLAQQAPVPSANIQTPPAQAVLPAAQIRHVKEEPFKDLRGPENGSSCKNDTTGAIEAGAEEQNGMDVDSIVSYVEERIAIETPQTIKKQLGPRRRKPGQQEKSDKLGKKPSLKNKNDLWFRPPLVPSHLKVSESLEEAAKTAAYKVAEAEEKSYYAALSVREAERLSKMQAESESIYQLAHEICDSFKHRTSLSTAV